MTSWVVTVRQILYSTRHRPILNEPADVSYNSVHNCGNISGYRCSIPQHAPIDTGGSELSGNGSFMYEGGVTLVEVERRMCLLSSLRLIVECRVLASS